MSALVASHYLDRAAHHLKHHEKRMARVMLDEARAAIRHIQATDPARHDLVMRYYALDAQLGGGRALNGAGRRCR